VAKESWKEKRGIRGIWGMKNLFGYFVQYSENRERQFSWQWRGAGGERRMGGLSVNLWRDDTLRRKMAAKVFRGTCYTGGNLRLRKSAQMSSLRQN